MSPSDDPGVPRHGGDLGFARAHYGEPAGGWLDLSTGVNPWPYPAQPIVAADLARLPDRDALADLIGAARYAYRLPDDTAVVATPGSELAIRLLPSVVAPAGITAIVSPTYVSHAEAWRTAGRPIIAAATVEAVPADTSAVVVGNPNNPDGRVHDPHALVTMAHRLGERGGGLLIVDEAFVDLTPEASLGPYLSGLPAVVLRSFGKFYGLPGLRLGFVAGHPALVARLAALLGDWPVSSAAIAIGRAALADTAWQDETRRRLAAQASRLRTLLAGRRLDPIGGTDLFVLAEAGAAGAVRRGLARRGIWTRAFADRPTWLRIGLPGDEVGFARLDAAVGEITTPAAAR